MKPTPTKCTDGKNHSWKSLWLLNEYGSSNSIDWCRKCGCVTEFYKNEIMKKRERCLDDKKEIYIDIPRNLKE